MRIELDETDLASITAIRAAQHALDALEDFYGQLAAEGNAPVRTRRPRSARINGATEPESEPADAESGETVEYEFTKEQMDNAGKFNPRIIELRRGKGQKSSLIKREVNGLVRQVLAEQRGTSLPAPVGEAPPLDPAPITASTAAPPASTAPVAPPPPAGALPPGLQSLIDGASKPPPPVTTTASSLTENELRDWVEQYALAMPQPHGHHWWQNVIKKSGTDWGSIPVDFLAQVHANPDAFKPAV
jgi:hypothetical protein